MLLNIAMTVLPKVIKLKWPKNKMLYVGKINKSNEHCTFFTVIISNSCLWLLSSVFLQINTLQQCLGLLITLVIQFGMWCIILIVRLSCSIYYKPLFPFTFYLSNYMCQIHTILTLSLWLLQPWTSLVRANIEAY
jgi:hypothetical protein